MYTKIMVSSSAIEEKTIDFIFYFSMLLNYNNIVHERIQYTFDDHIYGTGVLSIRFFLLFFIKANINGDGISIFSQMEGRFSRTYKTALVKEHIDAAKHLGLKVRSYPLCLYSYVWVGVRACVSACD